MGILIPFPANVVLSLFTALWELILAPLAVSLSERYEGRALQKEIYAKEEVVLRCRQFGPLRLPVGKSTFGKLIVSILLSIGPIMAITYAESGMLSVQVKSDVTILSDTAIHFTGDENYRNGFIYPSRVNSSLRWHECVQADFQECKKRDEIRIEVCVRTTFYHPVSTKGGLVCLDKDTGEKRNASEIEVVSISRLNATIDKLGKEMNVIDMEGVFARSGTATMNGYKFQRFSVYRKNYGGAIVMWNETSLYIGTSGLKWEETAEWHMNSNGSFDLEHGIFTQGNNTKIERYVDALASGAATTIFRYRVDTAPTLLVHSHFASYRERKGSFEYKTSKFVEQTEITVRSCITIGIMISVLILIRFLSCGTILRINTYDGLSKLYQSDSQFENQFNKERVILGLFDVNDGTEQRIRRYNGEPPVERDKSRPLL